MPPEELKQQEEEYQSILRQLNKAKEQEYKWFEKYDLQKRTTKSLAFENGTLKSTIAELEDENKLLKIQLSQARIEKGLTKSERKKNQLQVHREQMYQQQQNQISKLNQRLDGLFEARDKLIAENTRLRSTCYFD
ncbi:hypothetical protein AHMF7605_11925 [Adhaeribacter arboris]|uniref:Uncharacterized protein n=1 Tax=Adhaeribacter arboris TaxID=2072846 RepID=A0A2T2YF90_9BACT|nr:hypothetical protein [Adhaeribacter arboris]PSR54179.1 hypothetical protein AHMF7605_11925 [Adhaeribacter arboris]